MNARKTLVKLFVALLVVAAGACAARAWLIPAIEHADREDDAGAGAGAGVARAAEVLDDADRRKVDAYGDVESEVSEILETRAWADEAGSQTYTFSAGCYVDGENKAHKFVITAAERTDSGFSFSAETDAGACLGVIAEDGEGQKTLSCAKLFGTGALIARGSAWSVEVEDPDGSIVELMGGEDGYGEVRQAVADYASECDAWAVKAEWTGTAELDYREGAVATSWSVKRADGKSPRTVTALVPFGGGGVEMSKG